MQSLLSLTRSYFPQLHSVIPAQPTLFRRLFAQCVYKTPPENYNPRFQVAAVFCKYKGRFLFLHRQFGKSRENTWGIPAA